MLYEHKIQTQRASEHGREGEKRWDDTDWNRNHEIMLVSGYQQMDSSKFSDGVEAKGVLSAT